jgi:hypothetical protein
MKKNKLIALLSIATMLLTNSCKKQVIEEDNILNDVVGEIATANSNTGVLNKAYFAGNSGQWEIAEAKLFGGIIGDTAYFSWPSLYNVAEYAATLQCNGQLVDTIFTYGDSAVFFRLKFRNNNTSTQRNRTIDFDPDTDNTGINCQNLSLVKYVTDLSHDGTWSYDENTNELSWSVVYPEVQLSSGETLIELNTGIVTYVNQDEFVLTGSLQNITGGPYPNYVQYLFIYKIRRKPGNWN